MEKQTQIVIIDLNPSTNRLIQSILKEMPGIVIQSESKDMAKGIELVKETNPTIVILNLHPSEESVMQIAQKINQNFPDIVLFMTSQPTESDVVIRAMRAGVREFFAHPVKHEELVNAVNKVLKTKSQSLNETGSKGKIFSVFGPKGGVGTTTMVSNLATTLIKQTKKDLIVVDLNLQLGNIAFFLNIKTKYSILDVLSNINNIDSVLFKRMLPKNSAGISLLAGPSKIEESEAIHGENIEQMLNLLRNIYDYIVIDTNSSFDDVTLKALDESDYIFVVSMLDIATIYNTKQCLEIFQKIGYDENKMRLIINRHTAFKDLDIGAMEKVLNYPIYWRIPNLDFSSALNSINKGIPITQMVPHSKFSQDFKKMIKDMDGVLPLKEEEKKTKIKKERFLKKFLKSKDNK